MSSTSFYCFICREIKPNAEVFQLHCKHMYCKECLNAYVESKLMQNKLKIKCFHPIKGTNSNNANNPNECNVELSVAEIKDLLTHEESGNLSLKKYEKLRYLSDHQDKARECPQCSEIVLKSRGFTEMNCKSCNHSFCFTHGEAHQFKTESCDQYEQRTRHENAVNQETIHKISKKCPGCTANVEKSGGCNHMKCEVCDTSFCWLCGIEVSDSIFPAHFQWWNPMGCVNMQMHEAIKPTCTALYGARLLATIQLVILGPVCLLLTAATILLFGCCCKYSKFIHKNFFNGKEPTYAQLVSLSMSMWGMVLMGIFVFFPLGVIGTALALVVVYPFWAVYRLCMCQMPIPEFVIGYFSCCWCLLADDPHLLQANMRAAERERRQSRGTKGTPGTGRSAGGSKKKKKGVPKYEVRDIEAPPFELGESTNTTTQFLRSKSPRNGNQSNHSGSSMSVTKQPSYDQVEAAQVFNDPTVLSPANENQTDIEYLRADHSVIPNHSEEEDDDEDGAGRFAGDEGGEEDVLLYDHKLNLIASNESSGCMDSEESDYSEATGEAEIGHSRTAMQESLHEISNILGADALRLLLYSTTAGNSLPTAAASGHSSRRSTATSSHGTSAAASTDNTNVLSNLGASISSPVNPHSHSGGANTWTDVPTPMGSIRFSDQSMNLSQTGAGARAQRPHGAALLEAHHNPLNRAIDEDETY